MQQGKDRRCACVPEQGRKSRNKMSGSSDRGGRGTSCVSRRRSRNGNEKGKGEGRRGERTQGCSIAQTSTGVQAKEDGRRHVSARPTRFSVRPRGHHRLVGRHQLLPSSLRVAIICSDSWTVTHDEPVVCYHEARACYHQ